MCSRATMKLDIVPKITQKGTSGEPRGPNMVKKWHKSTQEIRKDGRRASKNDDTGPDMTEKSCHWPPKALTPQGAFPKPSQNRTNVPPYRTMPVFALVLMAVSTPFREPRKPHISQQASNESFVFTPSGSRTLTPQGGPEAAPSGPPF